MKIKPFIFPIIVGLFIFSVFVLKESTFPFFIAALLAYIFHPLVTLFERKGFAPRWLSALGITALLLALIILLLIQVAPLIYDQLVTLATIAPNYVHEIQKTLIPYVEKLSKEVPSEYFVQIKLAIKSFSKDIAAWTFQWTQSLLNRSGNVLHALTMFVLIPVIGFYLLKDWPKLLFTVDFYIPIKHKTNVREQAKKVDKALASFARGQGLVSLILAIYYGTLLPIVGLEFGLLIGVLTGIMSFIPYVGAILGFGVSIIISLLQVSPWLLGDGGSWVFAGVIAALFVLGHGLESAVLSPHIIGKSIGLHPVWVIFSLLVGGQLFGFWGLLLATPIAGATAVIVRFALSTYYKNRYLRNPYPKKRHQNEPNDRRP